MLIAAALAPGSAVNPLSADSAPARDLTEALFSRAVSGARHGLPGDIAQRLRRPVRELLDIVAEVRS
ncbi:hypothetical protein ACQ143_01790 [Microbacterium sp. MC2]